MSPPTEKDAPEANIAVARLFATLLLTEPTPRFVEELEQSGAASMLRDLGLEFPAADDGPAFESLAAGFFETFVHPLSHSPPVQSLVESGVYEGNAAQSMRILAERAGVEFDAGAAFGAPIDHLGCQLLFWGAIGARDPETARAFAERHLVWAIPLLTCISTDTFHGRLAALVADFLRTL